MGIFFFLCLEASEPPPLEYFCIMPPPIFLSFFILDFKNCCAATPAPTIGSNIFPILVALAAFFPASAILFSWIIVLSGIGNPFLLARNLIVSVFPVFGLTDEIGFVGSFLISPPLFLPKISFFFFAINAAAPTPGSAIAFLFLSFNILAPIKPIAAIPRTAFIGLTLPAFSFLSAAKSAPVILFGGGALAAITFCLGDKPPLEYLSCDFCFCSA